MHLHMNHSIVGENLSAKCPVSATGPKDSGGDLVERATISARAKETGAGRGRQAMTPDGLSPDERDLPPSFELQVSLPYLSARVGKLAEAHFTPALNRAGLTVEMWRVLAVLCDDGPSTLRGLSEATSVKASTLSRLVGRMIERDLISRVPSASDSRAVEVSVRPKGTELVAELTPEAARIDQIMRGAFRPAELPLLRDFLKRLYAVLADPVRPERAAGSDGDLVASANGEGEGVTDE